MCKRHTVFAQTLSKRLEPQGPGIEARIDDGDCPGATQKARERGRQRLRDE